jgi:hypothetical protein
MRIKQLLESATAGGMSTASVATVAKGSKTMLKRQKPTDNALDSGKLFQETNAVEGSVSKEKQKTPYKDINSAEYRAAADKQKQRMDKDKAAEPGKKLADKIAQKGVAEGEVEENKKGVRAVKHTVKPRNFVAKNAVQSGAGAHKDKKKAQKQGDVKHKAKEPAYESKLQAALDRRIIR